MASIIQVTPSYAVAPQIAAEDLPAIAAEGYRTIINVRPDNEAAGQPAGAAIEAEAKRLGLDYCHVPVIASAITDEQVARFEEELAKRPGPVFCFCRTGTRAVILWALAEASRQQPFAILKAAEAAGYDISAFASRIEQRRKPA